MQLLLYHVGTHTLGDSLQQQITTGAGCSAQPDTLRYAVLIVINTRLLLQQVKFIKHLQLRNILGADLLQHRLHLVDVVLARTCGDIDNMQQQVGADSFLQRGLERLDQLVRQMGDESHCIRHDNRAHLFQLQPTQGRVEGGKQLVRGIHLRVRQPVEQGGLARVGIAHQRNGRHLCAPPGTPALVALAPHFFQTGENRLDAHAQQAAVGFQLGFTRAAQPDAAFLSLKVGPAPHQAGAHVLQLCQFHLQFALVGTGALRENVQNEPGAVQHATLELPLKVTLLAGAQCVIENHQFRFVQLHLVEDFLHFTGAYEGAGVGHVATAHDKGHGVAARGQHKLFELAGILALIFTGNREVHQYRALT